MREQVDKPAALTTSDNGATWIVTFLETRSPTEEGMVKDGGTFEKAFVPDDPRSMVCLPCIVLMDVICVVDLWYWP